MIEPLTELKRHLTTDPEGHSESRDQGRRIMFASPLAMIFRVRAESKTVTIIRVRMFDTHD